MRYGDNIDNTVEENSSIFSQIRIYGMWAAKLCTNKILQFLTGGANMQVHLHVGHKTGG